MKLFNFLNIKDDINYKIRLKAKKKINVQNIKNDTLVYNKTLLIMFFLFCKNPTCAHNTKSISTFSSVGSSKPPVVANMRLFSVLGGLPSSLLLK